MATEPPDLAALGAAVAARSGELRAAGRWSSADDAALEAGFETAVVAALRVPRFAERSRKARALASRLVPEPLRPAAKSAARFVERAVRAVHARTVGRR